MLRYRRILGAFLGFYAPVEARLRTLLAAAPPLGVPFPDRARLLAADLVAVGAPADAMAGNRPCTTLPPLGTLEDGAGCLYVLEGASLGGRVISACLRSTLGLSEQHGASFFASGPDTGRRWKRVVRWLDELSLADADPDAIVASADRTFASLENWLELNEATR